MEHGSSSRPEPRLRTSPSSMYFDFLPTDVFPTIIKYVFSEANSEEELGLEQDISTASAGRQRILNLSTFVSDDSPFCDALSQLSLSQVNLRQVSNISRLWMDNSSLEVGPEVFENEGLKLGIPERLFQLCGESVKDVSILIDSKDLLPKEAKHSGAVEKFVKLVKLHCPNVQHLSFESFLFEEDGAVPFGDSLFGLIQQFSSQLYSIEWEMYAADKERVRLPDISTCGQIRNLNFPASPELISFLRTCGGSLESLTVLPGDVHGYDEMLNAIEENATKLSSVWLHDCSTILTVGEERYKSFLCSFGSQLTCAAVEGLSNEKLAEVLRSCPNLLINSHTVSEGGIEEWECVSLLGPMIKTLSVAANTCRDEKCEEAIAKCTMLETLIIENDYGSEEEGMENSSGVTFLLSLPAPSLLTNLYYFDFTATQTNIYKLSSAVSNLEWLFLDLVKPIDAGIDFKAISYTNPHLNYVCIQECIGGGEKRKEAHQSMEVLQMLVRAFLKCRSIEFILVDCDEGSVTRDEIHDICGSLPCRGVEVRITVGTTCYLQSDRSWW